MKVQKTNIDGLALIEPQFFRDDRGSFFEAFKQTTFEAAGLPLQFPQDNMSVSQKGVVRGLHFQVAPFEQGKIVRCVKGAIYDVALDIRPHSPTYGQYSAFELNDVNQIAFYIPPGFAHGFQALTDDATIWYKCTQIFAKEYDAGVSAFDPALKIKWPLPATIISEKDKALPTLAAYSAQFKSK